MLDESKDQKKSEEIGTEEAQSRIYEVGYLLVPTVAIDDVPVLYGNLKELVSSLDGEMISDEMPKMIPLAYAMSKTVKNVKNKFDSAYFGWVKFGMDTDSVTELKKKLDLDSNVIRFLITKTVKENTIAAKRFVHRDMIRRRPPTTKKEGDETPVEINKEEIDKEIDALVAV